MRKKPNDRILRGEPNEQHLSTVPKSCSKVNSIIIYSKVWANTK